MAKKRHKPGEVLAKAPQLAVPRGGFGIRCKCRDTPAEIAQYGPDQGGRGCPAKKPLLQQVFQLRSEPDGFGVLAECLPLILHHRLLRRSAVAFLDLPGKVESTN